MPTQLTFTQDMALGFEVDQAADLARSALKLLTDLQYLEQHAAVLTLWSIAAEKMLKLTLGLIELEEGRGWPSIAVMRRYGHNLERLNADVAVAYRRRLTNSPAHQDLGLALVACDVDPVLRIMLEASARWGLQGRFDGLDTIAGEPGGSVSAGDLWEQAERQVFDLRPAMMDKLRSDSDGFRSDLNCAIHDAMEGWWNMHVRSWRDGLAGVEAAQRFEELDLAPWA